MSAPVPDTCLNCSAAMTGPYCAQCGQHAVPPDLTLREVLREFTQELAQWDGKIPATVRALFLHPGKLTTEFLAGRRARWLPPLRLYLICSLVMFLSSPFIEWLGGRSQRQNVQISLSEDGRTTLTDEERQELARHLPGRIFGVERLERAAANGRQLNDVVSHAFANTALFLLMPVFALLTRALWRRLHYPAHLYAALHLHAAWFMILTLQAFAVGWVPDRVAAPMTLAAGICALVYSLKSFRRVFGDPWPKTLLKSVAVAAVYTLCLFAAALATLAVVVFTI